MTDANALRKESAEFFSDDDPRAIEQRAFDNRLQNWCKVARGRGWQSAGASCWSAEGRYVAPADDVAALEDEDAQEAESRLRRVQLDPWPVDPDVARERIADAWRLEDAWRYLPERFRLMLVYALHRRVHPARVTVALGVRRDQYEEIFRKARAMLRNRARTLYRS